MLKKAHVSFKVEPFEGTFSITPIVNGTPLPEMVEAFEREQHFEPTGGYGGLIPAWFEYGALDQYFLGHFEKAITLPVRTVFTCWGASAVKLDAGHW